MKNNYCTCCAVELTSDNLPFDNATFCLDCGEREYDEKIANEELSAFDMYSSKEEELNNHR